MLYLIDLFERQCPVKQRVRHRLIYTLHYIFPQQVSLILHVGLELNVFYMSAHLHYLLFLIREDHILFLMLGLSYRFPCDYPNLWFGTFCYSTTWLYNPHIEVAPYFPLFYHSSYTNRTLLNSYCRLLRVPTQQTLAVSLILVISLWTVKRKMGITTTFPAMTTAISNPQHWHMQGNLFCSPEIWALWKHSNLT